ncbi:MAG: prolipoprotein diacylglyceryl transferase [Polyangiaceae bacterium]
MDWAYLALMATAIMVGVLVRRALPKGPSETRLQRLALFLGAIIGSTFFAKLPYALSDWQSLVDGSAWLKDGRTITWGLAGGYLGVEVAKLVAGVRHKTGDGFAAPVAASIAVGRLGCFHAGCCFGRATDLPWAVRFGDGVARHPTQLYEFAFHATAAVLLTLAARRGLFRTQLIKLYLMAYMLWRIATELLRPEPRVLWGLTFYQLSSMVFFVGFAALFFVDSRKLRVATA